MSSPAIYRMQPPRPASNIDNGSDAQYRGAVDALDVAARLEVDGLNDSLVEERHGYENIFALADDVHARSSGNASGAAATKREWRQLRGHLVGSVNLALACVLAAIVQAGAALSITSLLLMSGIGWIGSQALSSGVWAKKDVVGTRLAVAAGVSATVKVSILGLMGLAVALLVEPGNMVAALMILVWFLFTAALGFNSVMDQRMWSLIAIASALAMFAVSARLTTLTAPGVIGVVTALTVAVWVPAYRVDRSARSIKRRGPLLDKTFLDGTAIGFAMTSILAISLALLVLAAEPAVVLPMVLGTIASVAVAEPLLVIFRHRIRSARRRSRDLGGFRRLVMQEAVVSAATIFSLSAGVTLLAFEVLADGRFSLPAMAAAGVYSTVSTACIALNAFGASKTAVAVSLTAVATSLIFRDGVSAFYPFISLITLIPCILVVARMVADPRAST